ARKLSFGDRKAHVFEHREFASSGRFGETPGQALGADEGSAHCRILVLLRQTCNRSFRFDRGLLQHGQRSSAATRRAAISRRRVAIESGTWRSVRRGSAPRPVIFGKSRYLDDRAATRFRGGKSGPFGHQEGVRGNA